VKNRSAAQIVLTPILVFTILIAILGFIKDILNTINYGGIDQRNRIVGARLMMDGKDPYHTKWQEGESDYFFDPCDFKFYPVNRVTVPPTVLTVHSLMAKWPHAIQRYFWAVLNWTLLLLSILLLSKIANCPIKAKLVWITGLLVSSSWYWRMHIEFGQIYMVYAFLIVLAFWLAVKNYQKMGFLSGFVIGIATSLRPQIGAMGLPVLAMRKWRMLIGCILGGSSGIAASFIYANLDTWKSYFSAMRTHSLIHIFEIIPISGQRIRPESSELLYQFNWGLDFTPFDSSIRGFFYEYLNITLHNGILMAAYAFVLVLLSILLLKHRAQFKSPQAIFWMGVVLVILFEYFTPAFRNPYNNIIWFLPLSLTIINLNNYQFILNRLNFLLLVGMSFYSVFNYFPEVSFVSDFSLLFYTIFTMVSFILMKPDAFRQEQKSLLEKNIYSTISILQNLHVVTGRIVERIHSDK